MVRKDFHIISCGVSILTNAKKSGVIDFKNINDESYWENFKSNNSNMNKLNSFFYKDPKSASAEISSFLDAYDSNIRTDIYLFGTETLSNEICRKLITDYFLKIGCYPLTPTEISGYFRDLEENDYYTAEVNFREGISKLLNRLVHIIKRKKKDGYRVFLNPTGGLKGHVITAAVAGFLTGCEIYYKNEDFTRSITLPPLIHIPTRKEIDLLETINNKGGIVSSSLECERIYAKYSDEVEGLSIYNFIELEKNERGDLFRIRITSLGRLMLESLKNA